MSIRVMTMVWDNYPAGGSELLLALALADFGGDDGTRIFPSIRTLTAKTRLSERSIQYLLDKMRSSGFLQVVEQGGMAGKKKRATEYRINLDRIMNGVQSLHPSGQPVEKSGVSVDKVIPTGATGGADGCNPAQKRVQPIAPHTLYIHQEALPAKPETRTPEIEGQGQNRQPMPKAPACA